jgi:hypothetical protein
VLGCLVVAAAAVAWTTRWVQDDAYITFRYARNTIAGFGPIWNPGGEAIEGYTNFSWMMLLAGAMKLGFTPEVASAALGIACFVGSLLLVFGLGRMLFARSDQALLATALTATNYSFLSYATGGLETSLEASLTLAALFICVDALRTNRIEAGRALLASVIVALALLTRPDSVILASLTMFILGWVATRGEGSRTKGRVLVALAAPAAVIVGTWLVWKYSFYGRILPNTFDAKLGTIRPGTLARGLAYLGWLPLSYGWLVVLAGLAVAASARGMRWMALLRVDRMALPLVVYGALWAAYVVKVGGDIMEFRQLVPLIPLGILLIVHLAYLVLSGTRGVAVAAAFLIAGSVFHGTQFPKYVRPPGIGMIPVLRQLGIADPNSNWRAMGIRLRDSLSPDSEVAIAVSPAGAIPYYSGLRTVDIIGLNDRWVARYGHARGNRGCVVCLAHQRLATIDYLNRSNINLIIGHPQLVSYSTPEPSSEAAARVVAEMFFLEDMDFENLPPDSMLLRIPLHDDVAFAAAYIHHDPEIDRLIAAGVWRAQPIGPMPDLEALARAKGWHVVTAAKRPTPTAPRRPEPRVP